MLNSKDDFLSSPSSSSLMLSSITTSSNPYELSEDSTNTFMDNEDDGNGVVAFSQVTYRGFLKRWPCKHNYV